MLIIFIISIVSIAYLIYVVTVWNSVKADIFKNEYLLSKTEFQGYKFNEGKNYPHSLFVDFLFYERGLAEIFRTILKKPRFHVKRECFMSKDGNVWFQLPNMDYPGENIVIKLREYFRTQEVKE